MTSLLAGAVGREPLGATDGRSGSLLERVVLADGRALVVKHVRDSGDWIMRACHDHGRAAELWSTGVLNRVPAVIDHAVLGAERVEGGWVVVMRDVSAALFGDHARVSRDDSRRVLEAAAALHAAFEDDLVAVRRPARPGRPAGRPPASARAWPRTGPSCWSSRRPARGSAARSPRRPARAARPGRLRPLPPGHRDPFNRVFEARP
jgi:hypothetical protein